MAKNAVSLDSVKALIETAKQTNSPTIDVKLAGVRNGPKANFCGQRGIVLGPSNDGKQTVVRIDVARLEAWIAKQVS